MISPGREAIEHRLTQRDLDSTPDDGNCYEVIDGELYVTPFPSYAHQVAATRLLFLLMAHIREHRLGQAFASGLKVVLDEPTGVGPDIVFISTARMDRMKPDGYYGAPDLLVEVTSTKPALDRYVKFHKYARAGVPHYWVVDPDRRLLSAFRLRGETYEAEAEHSGRERFRPVLFPGLELDLAELWSEL